MSAADFVQRWFRKAYESEDCFDRFFSAWIALVIKARSYLHEKQLTHPDTDRIAIIRYFVDRSEAVANVLADFPEEVAWLAVRKGIGTGQPILDVLPPTHTTFARSSTSWLWSGPSKRRESPGGSPMRPLR